LNFALAKSGLKCGIFMVQRKGILMRSYSSRRGQGVIEYLLIVTAVVVILIAGVLNKGGVFIKGTGAVLDFTGNRIDMDKSKMSFNTTP
jgi:hypothetical protein